jgi:transcriptional regulator with XRE-family HTH domain
MCANNIKALRVAAKKTQTQVARDLGVKLDRYRSWEQGKRNPTGEMGIQIAEYFGVTTDTVFGSRFAETIQLTLSQDEEMLLGLYRSLNQDLKRAVIAVANALAN